MTAADPRLVVLGVAQDGGHPQAGCTRPCCAGAWGAWGRPTGGHRVACLGIVDGDARWLVDCTPDLPSQLRDLGGPPLAGILLTHAHAGHYTGLLHLGPEVWAPREVPVWAMPAMAAFLTAHAPWSDIVGSGHVALRALADGVPVALSPRVRVEPVGVPHRGPWSETVAFVIEGPRRRVLFVPDVDRWDTWARDPVAVLASVDLAYVDGTFFDASEVAHRDVTAIPHPFVETSLSHFADLPAGERAKIRFIHLNHTNPLLDPGSAAHARVRAAGFGVAAEGEITQL